VGAVLHFAIGLRIVTRLAGVDYRPLLAQSLRTLMVVIAPASTLAFLTARLPADAWLQLLSGLAVGLAWTAVVVCTVPVLRRDVTPLLRVLRQSMRSSA
jgi:hypothetical protein